MTAPTGKAEDIIARDEELREGYADNVVDGFSGTFAADVVLAREIVALKKRIAHLENITHAYPNPHIPEHRPRPIKPSSV